MVIKFRLIIVLALIHYISRLIFTIHPFTMLQSILDVGLVSAVLFGILFGFAGVIGVIVGEFSLYSTGAWNLIEIGYRSLALGFGAVIATSIFGTNWSFTNQNGYLAILIKFVSTYIVALLVMTAVIAGGFAISGLFPFHTTAISSFHQGIMSMLILGVPISWIIYHWLGPVRFIWSNSHSRRAIIQIVVVAIAWLIIGITISISFETVRAIPDWIILRQNVPLPIHDLMKTKVQFWQALVAISSVSLIVHSLSVHTSQDT